MRWEHFWKTILPIKVGTTFMYSVLQVKSHCLQKMVFGQWHFSNTLDCEIFLWCDSWKVVHLGIIEADFDYFFLLINKIQNLLGPIYSSSDPWSLMSFGKWAADITWSMSSWLQLVNKQLTPVGQWAADVIGQWAINISRPMSSWHQLANEQLASLGQWAYDISRPMISWYEQAN